MSAAGNLLTEWSRLLAATLRYAGVADVVVSPGSRSTPFVWALLHQEGLRCRSIIDERDAAFFALGHARITGRPVAVVCTSGSAAANYFPAVVEAARSGVPLLVLTADRPFELQAADAPQTIDQVRLYGAFARAYLDPGMPDPHPDALRALQRTVAQAVHRTRWPAPGPVQVDLRARKPLEPAAATDPASRELASRVDRLIEAGPTRPMDRPRAPSPADMSELASACARARRGVIVCGPVPPRDAADPAILTTIAERTGFALLPEATSQLRFRLPAEPPTPVCDAFDTLLRSPSFRSDFAPDLVLQVGSPPTSTGWREFLAGHAGHERHVLALNEWSDPHGDARSIVHAPLDGSLRALLGALDREPEPAPPDERWLDGLRSANARAWAAVDEALDGHARGNEPAIHEGVAVRAVVDALPRGAVLALGNSLPVREVDTFCPAGDRDLIVWSQRGAGGIDGLVAGAAGAADASGRPTALLLGDVSLLHDLGGLATARDARVPLAIVVLDNGGGRIFEQLPFAAQAPDPRLLAFWSTPPRLGIEAAAAAFGIPYRAADRRDDLLSALRAALAEPGATMLHVRVDGERTVPLHRAIWAAVEKDLETGARRTEAGAS